jgi:hypothetical protein
MVTMKKIKDDLKSNVKQGLGDAADTISRIPTRMLGMMGNGASKNSLGAKNKGESSAVEMGKRLASAGNAAKVAFMGKKKSMSAPMKKMAKK